VHACISGETSDEVVHVPLAPPCTCGRLTAIIRAKNATKQAGPRKVSSAVAFEHQLCIVGLAQCTGHAVSLQSRPAGEMRPGISTMDVEPPLLSGDNGQKSKMRIM